MRFAGFSALLGLAAAAHGECDALEDNECIKNFDANDEPLQGAIMFQIDKHPHKSRGAGNPLQSETDSDRKSHHHVKHAPIGTLLEQAPSDKAATYGDTKCPCIGFEGFSGIQIGDLGRNITVNYSMDVGTFCKAWDYGVHPLCPVGGEFEQETGWCTRSWCFVDPCNCDLKILPSKASFAAPTTFRQRPLYYSHATCSQSQVPEVMDDPMPAGMCEQKPQLNYGQEKCACIGFDNIVDASLTNASSSYPLFAGSSCRAWDKDYDPLCADSENPPAYCEQAWCYVDPCSCSEFASVLSEYRRGITWKGHSIYYSYETCGEVDKYTETMNKSANAPCENLTSSSACMSIKECIWTGASCVETGKLACEIYRVNLSSTVSGDSDVYIGSASSVLPIKPLTWWLLFWVAVAAVLLGCSCCRRYNSASESADRDGPGS